MDPRTTSGRDVERFGRALRELEDGVASPSQHATGRRLFMERVERNRSPRARLWSVLKWSAPIAFTFAIVLIVVLRGKLSVEPIGLEWGTDLIASAGSTTSGTLRFSDGTRIELSPTSRARVEDLGWRGARVRLAAGHAELEVVHRPLTRWAIEAGPFSITVTGTAFDVDWSEPKFEVRMRSGSVIVHGPLIGNGLELGNAQRLTIDLATGEMWQAPGSEDVVATPFAPTSAVRPDLPPQDPPDRVPALASDPVAAPPGPSVSTGSMTWAQRVAAGDFRGVLEEAQSRGIAIVLARGSSPELAALSDAALYAGDTALAARALKTERERFPKTPHGAMTSFLLGRLAQDKSGAFGDAIDWYDRYLREQPAGVFASEALARKMLVLRKVGRSEEARTAAQEYLRRFPQGSQAGVARDIANVH